MRQGLDVFMDCKRNDVVCLGSSHVCTKSLQEFTSSFLNVVQQLSLAFIVG